MFGLGMGEALVLVMLSLLLFGGKRLPRLGQSLGEAINNFKKGLSEGNSTENKHDRIDDH